MKKLLLLISGIVLLLPLATFADGSGALSISTSPLPINLLADPGTTATTQLRVKNNGTSLERLKVTLLKFKAGDMSGQPALASQAPGDTYFDWVSFSPSVFDAPPGEWQTITMSIKIPKSAAFDYDLAAVFSREAAVTPTPGSTAVAGSTATLILLTVNSPNMKRQVSPISFTADRSFYEFLPTSFSVHLRNTGNVHVAPMGNIFITNGNSQVDTIQVNQTGGNILPGSDRIYTAQWTDGFPVYVPKQLNGAAVVKNGKPETTLKWDFTQVPKLRFGHYTAHLTMVYSDGIRDIPITAEVSFWVIPWRIIFIPIPIIILIVGLFLRNRQLKHRVKRLEHKR